MGFAGELIKVLDRGTSSMRVLLESMLFSIGPALFDVVAAAVLLYSKQAWMAAIVLVSVLFYVPVTIVITEYRGEMRREMNTLDNKVGTKACPHTPLPRPSEMARRHSMLIKCLVSPILGH